MLGDLDLREAEGAHHLDQDDDAGDDRRRATLVQAAGPRGARPAASPRARRTSAGSPRARACSRGRARGRRGRGADRSPPARSACRRRRSRVRALARAAPSSDLAISARTSLASASSSAALGGSVAMMTLGVAHGADLQRVVEADLDAVADDELGRAAADVDDEGADRSAPARPWPRGRSGEPRARRRGSSRRARSARAARRGRRPSSRRRGPRWSRSR